MLGFQGNLPPARDGPRESAQGGFLGNSLPPARGTHPGRFHSGLRDTLWAERGVRPDEVTQGSWHDPPVEGREHPRRLQLEHSGTVGAGLVCKGSWAWHMEAPGPSVRTAAPESGRWDGEERPSLASHTGNLGLIPGTSEGP